MMTVPPAQGSSQPLGDRDHPIDRTVELVSAYERMLQSLLEYEDDESAMFRKVSATLRDIAESPLAARSLFKLALIESTPVRSRFVADVLATHGFRRLAVLLADHGLDSSAKKWQRGRLSSLIGDSTLRVPIDVSRAVVTIGISDRNSHSIAWTNAVGRFRTRAATSRGDWFSSLVGGLDREPVGVHREVLIMEVDEGASVDAVVDTLWRIQLLPVSPIVIAPSARYAASLMTSLSPSVVSKASPVIAARSDDGAVCLVSAGGGSLSEVSRVSDFTLTGDSAPASIAAAVGLLSVFCAPALKHKGPAILEAFRQEMSEVFPLWSDSRSLVMALRFRGTSCNLHGTVEALLPALVSNGYYAQVLNVLGLVPSCKWDVDYQSMRIRSLYGVGRFSEIAETDSGDAVGADASQTVRSSRAAVKMLRELEEVSRRGTTERTTPVPMRVLSILHASAPEQSGGYAVRAHSLLRELVQGGMDVTAYTRPGFPESTNDLKAGESADATYEGVNYRRLGSSSVRSKGEYEYMLESIEHYKDVIRRELPSVVHLRSTYVSALPGLIAAKYFGIPVVYEVSGMWELVYQAANTAEMESRRARTVCLENAVLAEADKVVTITEAMRRIIAERLGLKRDVVVVPNAVSTEIFAPVEKKSSILSEFGWSDAVPVIGYVGSFVRYEGIDILLQSLAVLRDRGTEFRALFVGDGAEGSRLRALAAKLGLQSPIVEFTGRVPHEEVKDYYSVIDICVYPRRLTPATAAVSPLKPFEAMASNKTVIVSDVPALLEIAGHGSRARVVPAGSSAALADVLDDTLHDMDATCSMRSAAEQWVREERSWDAVGRRMATAVRDTMQEHADISGRRR